jgi:putative lipoic acid-binding regulatory protein
MNAANDPDLESALTFPCEFPIKVMGHHAPGFEEHVVTLISRHMGAIESTRVRSRASANGRFLAVTVTVVAESRAQLDEVYRSLSAAEQVLIVL